MEDGITTDAMTLDLINLKNIETRITSLAIAGHTEVDIPIIFGCIRGRGHLPKVFYIFRKYIKCGTKVIYITMFFLIHITRACCYGKADSI